MAGVCLSVFLMASNLVLPTGASLFRTDGCDDCESFFPTAGWFCVTITHIFSWANVSLVASHPCRAFVVAASFSGLSGS